MIGSGNIHRCRIQPCQAAIYTLQAEGEKLETFKAVSKIELTLETENSSLEIPVNFTRDDVAQVKIEFSPCHFMVKV